MQRSGGADADVLVGVIEHIGGAGTKDDADQQNQAELLFVKPKGDFFHQHHNNQHGDNHKVAVKGQRRGIAAHVVGKACQHRRNPK